MEPRYWIDRWKEGRTGFHLQGVNPLLERFWPEVAKGSERVLVPLCGKSEDVRWLAEHGQDVVGVDVSEIAARAFFKEQGIVFVEFQTPPFIGFKSPNLTFIVGSFFDLVPDVAGRFDSFYDRAALIALPPSMRQDYVRHLESLLNPGASGLLITIEYDESSMSGPPFSVGEEEVRGLFRAFSVRKLHEYDCLDAEPRFRERGLRWMKEVVYGIVAEGGSGSSASGLS